MKILVFLLLILQMADLCNSVSGKQGIITNSSNKFNDISDKSLVFNSSSPIRKFSAPDACGSLNS